MLPTDTLFVSGFISIFIGFIVFLFSFCMDAPSLKFVSHPRRSLFFTEWLFIVIVYHTIAEYVQVFESDTKWKKKQKKMHRRIRYDKIREEESDDVIDTEKR